MSELETLRAQLAEAKEALDNLTNNRWTKLEVEHAELGAKVWSLQLRSGLKLEELYENFGEVEARHQKEISDLHVQYRKEYTGLKAENEALRNVLNAADALCNRLPSSSSHIKLYHAKQELIELRAAIAAAQGEL